MNPKQEPVTGCPSSLALRAVALFALVLIGLSLCFAQSGSTGSILGQVVDQQNAVVPGAVVTVVDVGTNSSQTTTTNETGRYTFANVPPGTYDISVSMTGFSTAKISGQKVTVGETSTTRRIRPARWNSDCVSAFDSNGGFA